MESLTYFRKEKLGITLLSEINGGRQQGIMTGGGEISRIIHIGKRSFFERFEYGTDYRIEYESAPTEFFYGNKNPDTYSRKEIPEGIIMV